MDNLLVLVAKFYLSIPDLLLQANTKYPENDIIKAALKRAAP